MKSCHKDAAYFSKVAMVKSALAFQTKALGLGAGLVGVKAYKSYTNPEGYLGRARNAYLRSRYMRGGALNYVARGLDYTRGTVHKLTAPY